MFSWSTLKFSENQIHVTSIFSFTKKKKVSRVVSSLWLINIYLSDLKYTKYKKLFDQLFDPGPFTGGNLSVVITLVSFSINSEARN